MRCHSFYSAFSSCFSLCHELVVERSVCSLKWAVCTRGAVYYCANSIRVYRPFVFQASYRQSWVEMFTRFCEFSSFLPGAGSVCVCEPPTVAHNPTAEASVDISAMRTRAAEALCLMISLYASRMQNQGAAGEDQHLYQDTSARRRARIRGHRP